MKQNKKIRIAVIGVGVMGSLHARDIDALDNTELAAICDIKQKVTDKYAQMYEVPVFFDHKKMYS